MPALKDWSLIVLSLWGVFFAWYVYNVHSVLYGSYYGIGSCNPIIARFDFGQ